MIKETQLDNLRIMIYNLLISDPEMGLEDMPQCSDAANMLVDEWIELNNITIQL